MSGRLASAMLVSALIKQVEIAGGTGAVLYKGDAVAGALLLVLAERGHVVAMRERGLRQDGSPGWIPSGPAELGDAEVLTGYIQRRRKFDSDIWVVELDLADSAAIDAMLENG